MQFIDTQKHNRKLIRNGYMYVYQKALSDGKTSWECVQRRGSKTNPGTCKARLKLDSLDRFVESGHEHSHVPSQTQTVKSSIKRRAETTNDTAQQVLAGEMAGISPAAAANLPQLGNIRRTIRSQRQTNENLPPLPATRAAIPVLPAEFQTTLSGQQFLLYDSGVADNDRIFMFGSPDAVTLLNQSTDWFADGTFKTVPEIFYQLYTLHALV